MEILQKLNYVNDAREFFRTLPVDKNLESYKTGLIDIKELKNILVLHNQFFYITEVSDFSNIYVNRNITNVLGYQPEDFLDMEFVYRNIHPDDVDFVYAFFKNIIAGSRKYNSLLLHDPFAAVISIDYRMHSKNDGYIRVNRQTCCFKTDHLGNTIYAISLFTDINHIKRSNLITYAWKSEEDLYFDFEDLAEQYQYKILTPREVEIIKYLSQGLSARQIGEKLFISGHTVIAHRRNILHKIKAKNTAELVKYAIEMGLI